MCGWVGTLVIERARRYWETARHLRGEQIVNRLWRRLRPPKTEAPRGDWRLVDGAPVPPAGAPGGGADGRMFTFLNQTLALEGADRWRPAAASRLWQYHLHYFRYLWALAPTPADALLADWLAANPPGASPGWEPYPTALRVREWLEWLLAQPEPEAGERGRAVASLAHQAAALEDQLEYHLGGNHLLEDAVTLCWAGLRLDGPRAARWRGRGSALLRRELAVQVLPDGGHAERSPMYQAILAEGILRLAEVAATSPAPGAEAIAEAAGTAGRRLAAALALLTHPDGRIALLNDAAWGEAPEWSALAARFGLASEGRPGAWALPDSGYYGWRGDDGTYLVCDAGPVGPDSNPGHAHGDIFSFELSVCGRRVIVDGGVHDYERGAVLDYCRSTAAHNTVEIDGLDQCEFWDVFRVARRGRPRDVAWAPGTDGFRLAGWHDGYRRLPGRPVHRREFHWQAPAALTVTDRVTARRGVTAVSRLHVHPDCAVESVGRDGAIIRYKGVVVRVRFSGLGRLALEESWFCPEFGRRIPNACLAWRAEGERLETGFRLEIE